jgi:hypothetical protein
MGNDQKWIIEKIIKTFVYMQNAVRQGFKDGKEKVLRWIFDDGKRYCKLLCIKHKQFQLCV